MMAISGRSSGPAGMRGGGGHKSFSYGRGSGMDSRCGYEELSQQTSMVKAVQGTWINTDCQSERYVVSGQNVTRMDGQGSRHFTLQWDSQRNQLQWGTQGRLSLTWLGEGLLCWVPSRQYGKSWRWQRVGSNHSQPIGLSWSSPVGQPDQDTRQTLDQSQVSGGYGAQWRRSPYRSGRSHPYGIRDSRAGWSGGGRRGYSSRFFGGSALLPCGLRHAEVCDLLFREITPDDYDTLLRLDETIARPTAAPDSIESLSTTSGSDLCGQDCIVCLAAFEANDVVTTLPCRHHFHRSCVTKWLAECRNACPLCGSDVGGASKTSKDPDAPTLRGTASRF